MQITLYSIDGCPMCSHARELFKRSELKYTEVKVGKDISRQEFLEKFPEVNAYPFITIDRMKYIGLVDVARYLLQKGYVSSSKNV